MSHMIAGGIGFYRCLVAVSCSYGTSLHTQGDTTEIRTARAEHGIISQQVLGTQISADLLKRFINRLGRAGEVVFPASVMRELDQRMLAAGVPAGIGRDRHNDDAVHQRVSFL